MKILFIFLILSANAVAMDRWTALAILESGGNDRAVGRFGEISRYQVVAERARRFVNLVSYTNSNGTLACN